MEGADNRWIAASEHAQDVAFGTAIVGRARTLAGELDQHLIAVHCRADGGRRDEDVARDRKALPGIRDDEAVAVAMHGEAAGDEVLACGGVPGQRIAVAASLDQAAALDQRCNPAGELPAILATQVELADELLVSGRVVRLAFDVAQDGLVGEHGNTVRITD